MRRREFITLLGGAAFTSPLAARAQEAGRTYRLGILSAGKRDAPYWLAMFDELPRAGFIEGQNLTVDWHQYRTRVDLIPEFAAELVKARVDVIVATGDATIRAVQRATTTIPILGSTDDMVGAGLVNSLARPDGNTTGTSIFAGDLDGERQEILVGPCPDFGVWQRLPLSNESTGEDADELRANRRLHATLSFQFIWIAEPRSSGSVLDAANAEGRGSAKCFVVSHPLRQPQDYY